MGKRRTVKIGSKTSRIDSGLFYWRENNTLNSIFACHVDDMTWGGNQYFKETIITKLKEFFSFSPQEVEEFTCIGTGLIQNSDFSVKVDQNPYIDSIQEIALSKEKIKDWKKFFNTK